MFRNYFITAIRSLSKNRTYTSINILGLALGIGCCLIIFLIIQTETSFDNFHPRKDRIYRVVSEENPSNGKLYLTGTHFPASKSLRIDFPELEAVVATKNERGAVVSFESSNKNEPPKKFREETGVGFAESSFFEVFGFELVIGNPSTVLDGPSNAVISESTARKYFMNENPIGKTLIVSNKAEVTITGVFKDFPRNTDFPFNKLILSWQALDGFKHYINLSSWDVRMGSAQTFVVLPTNGDPVDYEQRLIAFAQKYLTRVEESGHKYHLQPLSELHSDERYGNYMNEAVTPESMRTLAIVGLFIIITASINFINLATAQAVKRSKEVGIRKVLGTTKAQLIVQFLTETTLITTLAVVIGLALSEVTLLYLAEQIQFIGTPEFVWSWDIGLFLVGITVFTSCLSGLYPALIISNYKPVRALKNTLDGSNSKGLSLRRVLVVTQFTIAQVLIIGMFVVSDQMNHFYQKDLGFNKESIIEFTLPENDSEKFAILKEKLLQNSAIQKASFSLSNVITDSDTNMDIKYHKLGDELINVDLKLGDADFMNTYGLELVAGREILPSDDLTSVIINETLLKKLQIASAQEAIGERIQVLGGQSSIVGVVQDFHMTSFRNAIKPSIISSNDAYYFMGSVKSHASNLPEALAHLEASWTSVFPEHIFDYKFVDDVIASLYEEEKRVSNLFRIFSLIAIGISCMGLLGLISFMSSQKTKEIGIRKVLGASVISIVSLFSNEFIKLVVLAFIISVPLSYYFMNEWLQNFAYRVDLTVGTFIIAGLVTVIIATTTVAYKSLHAALSNPVDALKNE